MNTLKNFAFVSLILLLFSCSNSTSDSAFLGKWMDAERLTEARYNRLKKKIITMSITKTGNNFIIEGTDIAGIYVKTKEGNLSGANGAVIIAYEKENNRLIVNDSQNINPISYWVEKKCDSKYQLSGELAGVDYDGMPCAYVYLEINYEDGSDWWQYETFYLDGNYENVEINGKKLFKWSDDKIKNFIETSDDDFPDDAIDTSLLNKEYIFCYDDEKQLNCKDEEIEVYFYKQIVSKQ